MKMKREKKKIQKTDWAYWCNRRHLKNTEKRKLPLGLKQKITIHKIKRKSAIKEIVY